MEQARFTFDVTVLLPAYVVKHVKKPILVQAFNNFAYTADLALHCLQYFVAIMISIIYLHGSISLIKFLHSK
jgi:hypothetical protein